ncbi:MAG: hypothetical protein Q8O53_01780 [Candidatus Moranbacteria bacterium]|nr:hypothetical protein [Candidatus Moranbacteria bacterium]
MKESTEVTLETLAQMVARGFQSVDEQLVEIKTDVSVLKEDVADLQVGMSALQVTVNRIDKRTQNQVDAVYTDMHALEQRVEVLEEKG